MASKGVFLSVLISLLIPVTMTASVSAVPSASQATFNGSGFGKGKSLIPNFSVVTPQLFRGAQPKPGGLQWLRANGVKTVINLRGAEKEEVHEEADEAQKLGLNYFNLPMSHFEKVPAQTWNDFEEIVTNPAMQPVFVHCAKGQDRTGAMCALYRIKHQGWSAEKSIDEMKSFGFHNFYFPLKRSVLESATYMGTGQGTPPVAPAEAAMSPRTRSRSR